jgi:hypothetical protein
LARPKDRRQFGFLISHRFARLLCACYSIRSLHFSSSWHWRFQIHYLLLSLEIKHSQRGSYRPQLPRDRSHHLPKEIIQFGYRGKRIQASPEGFVCFSQFSGALLRKQFPLAGQGSASSN